MQKYNVYVYNVYVIFCIYLQNSMFRALDARHDQCYRQWTTDTPAVDRAIYHSYFQRRLAYCHGFRQQLIQHRKHWNVFFLNPRLVSRTTRKLKSSIIATDDATCQLLRVRVTGGRQGLRVGSGLVSVGARLGRVTRALPELLPVAAVRPAPAGATVTVTVTDSRWPYDSSRCHFKSWLDQWWSSRGPPAAKALPAAAAGPLAVSVSLLPMSTHVTMTHDWLSSSSQRDESLGQPQWV